MYCDLTDRTYAHVDFGRTQLALVEFSLLEGSRLLPAAVDEVYDALRAVASHVSASDRWGASAAFVDVASADEAVSRLLPFIDEHCVPDDPNGDGYYRSGRGDGEQRRINNAKRRAAKPASGSKGASAVEYVYTWYWHGAGSMPSDSYSISRYQILRKTKKFLLVTQERAGHLQADTWDDVLADKWEINNTRWEEEDGITITKTIRLDRAKIEAGESVSNRGHGWWVPPFHKDLSDLYRSIRGGGRGEKDGGCPPGLLPALEKLGLTSPTTADAVKAAYRVLALQHHPDRNVGDPEAEQRFKDVQSAYEQLRKFFGE
jgi:hypothetical protein